MPMADMSRNRHDCNGTMIHVDAYLQYAFGCADAVVEYRANIPRIGSLPDLGNEQFVVREVPNAGSRRCSSSKEL
jgi:hypothetical protein